MIEFLFILASHKLCPGTSLEILNVIKLFNYKTSSASQKFQSFYRDKKTNIEKKNEKKMNIDFFNASKTFQFDFINNIWFG